MAAPFEAPKARYEYTDNRVWEVDAAALLATSPADTAPVSVRRIKQWTNTVDSGRAYAVDEAQCCPAETDDTWTTREAGLWDGPLSSDPDAVHRQLLGPPPDSGIDLFGQIGQLYGARVVPLATRRGMGRAAETLNNPRGSFTSQISHACAEFFDWWHQGETPSGMWGRDTRRSGHRDRPRWATTAVRQRTTRRGRVEADNAASGAQDRSQDRGQQS